jgi:4-amino-4-deoxy-L-arabinose transferase-like glycosyltransferase
MTEHPSGKPLWLRLADWMEIHSRPVSRWLCLLVFVEAALLSAFSGDRLRFPDEQEYHALAMSLAQGKGFLNPEGNPTSYRPPGYPFLLAAVYQVSARPLAGKLLNAALLAAAAGLLASLAGRHSGLARAATPACFLVYPLLAFTASTLYAQTFALFLLSVAVFLLFLRPLPGAGRAVALGLVWGLLVLTVPSFILITPLFFAGWIWLGRACGLRAVATAVLFASIATLVVGLWSLRNWRVHGSFVLISTNSGISLITGNSPHAGADTGVNLNLDAYRAVARTMNEVEQDRYYKKEAKAWMLGNPGDAIRLYAAKVVNYFNFRSRLRVQAESSPSRDAVMFVSYYFLLGLVALRLAAWRRWRPDSLEAFLLLLYFGNAFLSALFFTRIRFRVPFDAVLALLAALAIARWVAWRRRNQPF